MQIVKQQELLGKEFTIYGTADEPLFLAKDVANWIDHKRARDMIKTVDEDERVRLLYATSGGQQEQWFLTEDGGCCYEI